MKTRQQKQKEALARREKDLAKWQRLLTDEQGKVLGKIPGASDRAVESLTTKVSRASADVRNLRLSLGESR